MTTCRICGYEIHPTQSRREDHPNPTWVDGNGSAVCLTGFHEPKESKA